MRALYARLLPRGRRRGKCLVWTGSHNRDGYGTVRVGRKVKLVHRIAYEALKGPIPPGQMVRHSCDNPPCFEGAHLLLGTATLNGADMARKNRSGKAKLTLRQVRQIRRRRQREDSARALAEEFGISLAHVYRIGNGTRRQYV